jgi:hypothetical protein
MWKREVMASFKILSKQLPVETKVTNENLLAGNLTYEPRLGLEVPGL